MISVMSLRNRYFIYIYIYIYIYVLYKANHTEHKQCCGGEINFQCTIFQVIFTTHVPTDIIKCLQEMLAQSVPMEQTCDIQFHAEQKHQ
jgi:hypothetical protein